jgi:hypothetical protein
MTFSVLNRFSPSLSLSTSSYSSEELSTESDNDMFSLSSSDLCPSPLECSSRLITSFEAKRLNLLLHTTLVSHDQKYRLDINLVSFFQKLFKHLSADLKLCGSSVAFVVNSKEVYRDKDFLIPLSVTLDLSMTSKEALNILLSSVIQLEAARVRDLIEDLVIEQFKEAYPKILTPNRREIFSLFFSSQFLKIDPIDLEKNKLGNRFSLVKFGEVEIKTTYNVNILWDTFGHTQTIEGLENPCAFDKDSLQIPLKPILETGEVNPLEVQIVSVLGSIDEALFSLKIGQLKTSAVDGSKFIKLLDYITFRSSFCDKELAVDLCVHFFEKYTPQEIKYRIETYFKDRIEKNRLGVITALLNIYILSKQASIPVLEEVVKDILFSVVGKRSQNFLKEHHEFEPLIADWMILYLTLFSSKQTISKQKKAHFLSFSSENHVYSLLKVDIVSLLTHLLSQPLDVLSLYQNFILQIRHEEVLSSQEEIIDILISKTELYAKEFGCLVTLYSHLLQYGKYPLKVTHQALLDFLNPKTAHDARFNLLPEALSIVSHLEEKVVLIEPLKAYAFNTEELFKISCKEEITVCLLKQLLKDPLKQKEVYTLFETLSEKTQASNLFSISSHLTCDQLYGCFQKLFKTSHFKIGSKELFKLTALILKKYKKEGFYIPDDVILEVLLTFGPTSKELFIEHIDLFESSIVNALKRAIFQKKLLSFLVQTKVIGEETFFSKYVDFIDGAFNDLNQIGALKDLFEQLKTTFKQDDFVQNNSSFLIFLQKWLKAVIDCELQTSFKTHFLIDHASWIPLTKDFFDIILLCSNYLLDSKNKENIFKIEIFFQDDLHKSLLTSDYHPSFFTLYLNYIKALLEGNKTLLPDYFDGTKIETKQDAKSLLKAFKAMTFFYRKKIRTSFIEILLLNELFSSALQQLPYLSNVYLTAKDLGEIADFFLFFISMRIENKKGIIYLTNTLCKDSKPEFLPILEHLALIYRSEFILSKATICEIYAKLCLTEPSKHWRVEKLDEMLTQLINHSTNFFIPDSLLLAATMNVIGHLQKASVACPDMKIKLRQKLKQLFNHPKFRALILASPDFKHILELFHKEVLNREEPFSRFIISVFILDTIFKNIVSKAAKYSFVDLSKILDLFCEHIISFDEQLISFENNCLLAEVIHGLVPLLENSSQSFRKNAVLIIAKYLKIAIINQSTWASKAQFEPLFKGHLVLLKELNKICLNIWGNDKERQDIFCHLIQQNTLALFIDDEPHLNLYFLFDAIASGKVKAINLANFFLVFKQSLDQIIENLLPRGIALKTSFIPQYVEKILPFLLNGIFSKNIISSIGSLTILSELQNDPSMETWLKSTFETGLLLAPQERIYFIITVLHHLTNSKTLWKLGLNFLKDPRVTEELDPFDFDKLRNNAKAALANALKKANPLDREDFTTLKTNLESFMSHIVNVTSWKIDLEYNIHEDILLPLEEMIGTAQNILECSGEVFTKNFEYALQHYINVLMGVKHHISNPSAQVALKHEKSSKMIIKSIVETKHCLIDALLQIVQQKPVQEEHMSNEAYFNSLFTLMKESLNKLLKRHCPEIEPLEFSLLSKKDA